MARGRKRKLGKREPNGRIQRTPEMRYDKGTERTQAMRERFGDHYSTAIGRAYSAGLLGHGQQGLDRYTEGKRFARVYARLIARPYRCPLNDTPRGLAGDADHERERREQDWFFDMARKLDDEGLRPWLDQLLSDIYTDAGPYWLDAILNGGKHPADHAVLECAVKALDVLTPKRRVGAILVAA